MIKVPLFGVAAENIDGVVGLLDNGASWIEGIL
jgi:hypothetical protein